MLIIGNGLIKISANEGLRVGSKVGSVVGASDWILKMTGVCVPSNDGA